MQQLEVTSAATDVAAQQSNITEPDSEKDSNLVDPPKERNINKVVYIYIIVDSAKLIDMVLDDAPAHEISDGIKMFLC